MKIPIVKQIGFIGLYVWTPAFAAITTCATSTCYVENSVL